MTTKIDDSIKKVVDKFVNLHESEFVIWHNKKQPQDKEIVAAA